MTEALATLALPQRLASQCKTLALGAIMALSVFGAQTTQAQSRIEREGLWILASGSTSHVTRELIEGFSTNHQLPARPRLDVLPTPQAYEAFCSGVGGATPDICPSSNDLRPVGGLCNGVSGPSAVKVRLRFVDASRGDAG